VCCVKHMRHATNKEGIEQDGVTQARLVLRIADITASKSAEFAISTP
jgi:hypothetical protein